MAHQGATAPGRLGSTSEDERIRSFPGGIDAIRSELEAELGEKDLAHLRRIVAVSTTMEIVGRGLIHLSLEPAGFFLGVLSLWAHKTLELMEIGHSALHGSYDRVEGATAHRSGAFRWKAPIAEKSWRAAHNFRHHQYANIAERDPDLDFGGLRLSPRVPYRTLHRLQPFSNLLTWLGFAAGINLHATGLLEVYLPSDRPRNLRDRSWASIWGAHREALSKFARYYAREYVFFPLLAGPFFWKTALGNFLSELGRDVYAAATIYCGHVGAADYPDATRAKGRARWYVMQAEGARDIQVPLPISILCGALDLQIEHHLFPRLPPNRLRQIAPRVRELCEAHGVRYRADTWRRSLSEVLGVLRTLSLREAG